jgi:hypothetical protein
VGATEGEFMKNESIKKRRGMFRVSFPILNNIDELRYAFSGMVITHAQAKYDRQEIEYIAYSNLFDEVEDGEKAPEYEIEIHRNNDGTVIGAKALRMEFDGMEISFGSSFGKTKVPLWALVAAWREKNKV